MTTQDLETFELQGRFTGFFRDVLGKRRMVLRVAGKEVYLRVPKALRHELDGALRPGQEIVVSGQITLEDATARERRIVSQVRVVGQSSCITCPIRVCAKKTCWRNGGQDLWRELERKIESAGLTGSVTLKAVSCLDECERGPNAEVGGREFHRCSPRKADEILAQFAGIRSQVTVV